MRKDFNSVAREEAIIKAGSASSIHVAHSSPKQNISEYLGSIARLQGSLITLSRSSFRTTDNVQMQMVYYLRTLTNLVSTHQIWCKTT